MPNQEFLNELAAYERDIEQAHKELVEDAIRQVLTAICNGNIKVLDTGRSTASWVVSTDSPVFYKALDVTEFNALSGDVARERSLFTLNNLQVYVLGESVFIANGNEYVVELEFYGKSRKAPEGFVQLAMANFPELSFTLSI